MSVSVTHIDERTGRTRTSAAFEHGTCRISLPAYSALCDVVKRPKSALVTRSTTTLLGDDRGCSTYETKADRGLDFASTWDHEKRSGNVPFRQDEVAGSVRRRRHVCTWKRSKDASPSEKDEGRFAFRLLAFPRTTWR